MKDYAFPNPGYGPHPIKKEISQFHVQVFDSIFPEEADCSETLILGFCEGETQKCGNCLSRDIERRYGERVGRCNYCGTTKWLTGGTIFHGIVKARPYLLAIWLMQRGVDLSANQLHELAGVSISTALKILGKAKTVANSYMLTHPSAEAGSLAALAPAICKPSPETPANKHPARKQEEIKKRQLIGIEQPGSTDVAAISCPLTKQLQAASALPAPAKEVFESLSTTPIHIDTLCHKIKLPIATVASSLTMLQLEELVERLPGEQYVRYDPTISHYDKRHHR